MTLSNQFWGYIKQLNAASQTFIINYRLKKATKKIQASIEKLKVLVRSKGYIYALCMILFEDFHIDPEELHSMNHWERLNMQEAALLLGFLVQDEIDFDLPQSPLDLTKMKKQTYKILRELHDAMNESFFQKMKHPIKAEKGNDKEAEKRFFGTPDMLMEPIFYSGTGAYDFQYLEFLDKKYKHDKSWLTSKKDFDLEDAKKFVIETKRLLSEKSKNVRHYFLKESEAEMIERIKKELPNEDVDKVLGETMPILELHQYSDLFFDLTSGETGFQVFCRNLIDLFCVKESEYSDKKIGQLLQHFSFDYGLSVNTQFDSIGKYNKVVSHPIIRMGKDKYFVTNTFLLYQAIYEDPFHWMMEDDSYRDQLAENRGKVGEEIAYEFLSKVFGARSTYTGVKISRKKGADDTDSDVLCVLGNKALCVQVKSKGLTLLSRQGQDQEQLNKDFRLAVQEAYEQGLKVRQSILDRNAKLIDKNGNEIKLSEEIDDVYIICLTTENYPSLIHQTHSLLDKKENDPYPLPLTVFDLDLLTHYLNDPYEFLYYVRQRTSLMEYFRGDDEMAYLGFHLMQKLWKTPDVDFYLIDPRYTQMIDRNYYPLKAGIKVSDKGDAIKAKWSNKEFEAFLSTLKDADIPQFTDIVFQLLDLSGQARGQIVKYISLTKEKTEKDNQMHSAALLPDPNYGSSAGLTFICLPENNLQELSKRLLTLCQVRKYKCKANSWIGFGSIKGSKRAVDMVILNNETWEQDDEMEAAVNAFTAIAGEPQIIDVSKI